MVKRTITITNPTGLHARPAAVFSRLAKQFDSEVILEYKGRKIDAKSMVSVLMASIGKGSEITLAVDGGQEQDALDKLVYCIENELE